MINAQDIIDWRCSGSYNSCAKGHLTRLKRCCCKEKVQPWYGYCWHRKMTDSSSGIQYWNTGTLNHNPKADWYEKTLSEEGILLKHLMKDWRSLLQSLWGRPPVWSIGKDSGLMELGKLLNEMLYACITSVWRLGLVTLTPWIWIQQYCEEDSSIWYE